MALWITIAIVVISIVIFIFERVVGTFKRYGKSQVIAKSSTKAIKNSEKRKKKSAQERAKSNKEWINPSNRNKP